MIDLGKDDGVVAVSIDGQEAAIDLWEVNSKLYDYFQAKKGRPDAEVNAGLVDLMAGLGLPRVSQLMAVKFVKAVSRAVEDKKKALDAPAESPGSTASTPEP